MIDQVFDANSRYALGKLTRELTAFIDLEALVTNNGRDDGPDGYRPTLRVAVDARFATLADAYDTYQIARGSAKRALRE